MSANLSANLRTYLNKTEFDALCNEIQPFMTVFLVNPIKTNRINAPANDWFYVVFVSACEIVGVNYSRIEVAHGEYAPNAGNVYCLSLNLHPIYGYGMEESCYLRPFFGEREQWLIGHPTVSLRPYCYLKEEDAQKHADALRKYINETLGVRTEIQ